MALDVNGRFVGKGDLQRRLAQAMKNVEIVLEAVEAKLEDIVFV